MVKRTYSQRAKRFSAASYPNSQDYQYSRKRVKKDNDLDDLCLPSPPPSRGEKTFSLPKKRSKTFGGPISIPAEVIESQVTSAPNRTDKVSRVFHKALGGNLKPARLEHSHSIHGSMEEFASAMKGKKKSGQGNATQNNKSLPSPPAEIPKASDQSGELASTKTSRLFESIIKSQPPKQADMPNVHQADQIPAPRHTILGDRLRKKSKEACLWTENQKNSPLLRLPGEIRNRIYEYALGGNTIKIDFETYRTTFKSDQPREVIPIFKYHCTVFDRFMNPFRVTLPPNVKITSGFGVLSGICRQLYLETDTLPFMLNMVSFSSHNVMFNMLFMEKRLSPRKLNAITRMILPDALPQRNALAGLRNLEKVMLAHNIPQGIPQSLSEVTKGWYRVSRRDGGEAELVNLNYNVFVK